MGESAPQTRGVKYRVNLSLPKDLAIMLNETAQNLGMSQSALLAALLTDSLPPLHRLSKRRALANDPDTAKRFRGESIDVILQQVAKVLKKL